MSTLQAVELGVLGPLQVRQHGTPVPIPGAKPRAVLTMLGLHCGSLVSADTLAELLWGEDPPRTAVKALQTHISALRRTLGDGFVLTEGAGWTLADTEVDAARYTSAARLGRDVAAGGDTGQAVARFDEALALWRGTPELPDGPRGTSERTRWIEGHAALVEDRIDALLAAGRAAEIVGELEAAVAEAPLRERRWGQLMLALYRAGRQGDALGAYRRARAQLADELGVDPGPELRRLEAAIAAQDASLDILVAQSLTSVTRAVTFLLTDIEGSTAAWEADADAMALALARHDALVEQVITARGGRLIKTRGEGDATFSVFDRPSAAATAAIELQDAIGHEPWALAQPMRIRVALHTGEVELRDGDYFGRAVNRAARLRSLADGGQILCSGATAELVIDSLPDDVALTDLGMRRLKNLPRPEHVFQLRPDAGCKSPQPQRTAAPMERPDLPAVLIGPGPFVGRGPELDGLLEAWQAALAGGMRAVLIAGEPGVGKTRLAGEWSRQAYEQGAVVLYGRCDEDLGAPYQPFAEALRALVPCAGADRLRGLRGVEALLALVPGLTDMLPDLAAPTRADPDTERYALFDAVVALLEIVSVSAPVVLILDDLHWAAKPTLLLLRHLLRFGERTRVQIIGTYRSTDLDRAHPLAAMLADLHRDGTADRVQLSGLGEADVTAYVTEAGYDDDELARALASVTGGNPFFLIEALRHVDESGGRWNPSTLPQGVREAVSRRLSRLTAETNKALAAAAVVGSRFALELVERVVDGDLVDAFDEACKAGIVIEESGGRYRFNHALVRQSLLAELPSVRRMRLHQRIATTLESRPGDDELLAELAHHYFECAWAGNAAKAVEYCRRAADQAMARLGYEGAADLYDRALHALAEIDEDLADRDDQVAALLIARCEALLAAGDVASAAGAVAQLQAAAADSARLGAWATCFDGQLSMLTHPERLDAVESEVEAAAGTLARIADAAGEAQAHTVRAGCLARLGRIGDCEIALDHALTAARRAGEHRRVNAVLAGAPLAALWGPNPVPRAGGRCLDVVRLLRITTDSPAVEATSTRCQAVLEAFRGRGTAARRMIESARRMVTELGLRHALLEVEQFAGIVELVIGDPAAAEQPLRRAYKGFRRMGLEADTAETAALLGRTLLALDRAAEADELCSESERLAGHALKASIAWRTLRALLLSRAGDHDDARRMAEDAVALAERTDALVDHGDACSTLATVLGAAGEAAEARAAATQAVDLYERKGAAALAEGARLVLGERMPPPAAVPSEAPAVALDNVAVRAGERVADACNRGSWDEFEQLFAPECSTHSRRRIVGFSPSDLPPDWIHQNRLNLEAGGVRLDYVVIAVRGQCLALVRLVVGTADEGPGAPHDEFLQLYGIDEDGRVALQVWFDLEDLDAALAELDAVHARFEAEHPPARRLENTAARVDGRFQVCFKARDWDAITQLMAEDICIQDRRQGLHRQSNDRATEVASIRAIAALGAEAITVTPFALRGDRLSLSYLRFVGEGLIVDALSVAEVDADGLTVARTHFDLDDFDAAIAELDARYLAGEAADCAHSWSIVTQSYAAANSQQLRVAANCVSVDHRRARAFAPGELNEYMHATWDIAPTVRVYVEAVHRLSNVGTVVTHVARGSSQEGFNAEWREVILLAFGPDQIGRTELFDEEDLDAALARFDQLSPPARRLENAASRIGDRFLAHFAAADWEAIAKVVADNFCNDDRRPVVGSGIRHGRDAQIADTRAVTDHWDATVTSTVIATRGERLALRRSSFSSCDQRSEVFLTEALGVVEIDTDERIIALVTFAPDDFEAAIAELDARYLAGEAAFHAHTWSLIVQAFKAFNEHELPSATPDWVNLDHRRGRAFSPGDLVPYIHATWKLTPEAKIYIEAVHRLSNLGAVVTEASHGQSPDGFDAEWLEVNLLTFDGDLINSSELFDEADIEAALARFDQLAQPTRQLENSASQVGERFLANFAAGEWDAMAEVLADDYCHVDRRSVVNAGTRQGRDAAIANMRAVADLSVTNSTVTVLATRGDRLALVRSWFSFRDEDPEAFSTEQLDVGEINADQRLVASISFSCDDFDAAIAELDARYLAGEAAAHAQTWSVIMEAYAGFNRRELAATTPDWVNIDHRRGAAFAPGDGIAYIHAAWNDSPDTKIYIETVHRLSDLGAVVSHVAQGLSQEGFDAEWRDINALTVQGDMISSSELFDEAHLDAAVARFEELSRPAPRLENAASQATERFYSHYRAKDWDAMAQILSGDCTFDDRRHGVNAGIWSTRDVAIANMRAYGDVGVEANTTLATIATRGKRLALSHLSSSYHGSEFEFDLLSVVETDVDGKLVAYVGFDLDDFDAAIAELDARYLAGEAAAHPHAWSVITKGFAALLRGEIPVTATDFVDIDHRQVAAIGSGDLKAYLRVAFDTMVRNTIYVESVHSLTDLGAVITHVAKETSRDGFDAEWRMIDILTVDGDLINRGEIFDESDLDAAFARFDELDVGRYRV